MAFMRQHGVQLAALTKCESCSTELSVSAANGKLCQQKETQLGNGSDRQNFFGQRTPRQWQRLAEDLVGVIGMIDRSFL